MTTVDRRLYRQHTRAALLRMAANAFDFYKAAPYRKQKQHYKVQMWILLFARVWEA